MERRVPGILCYGNVGLFKKGKMKMKNTVGVISLIIGTFFGGVASVFAANDANGFEKPSAQVVKALKATVGKEFSAGYVFVNGRYVAPPYKVARYGNVIRINDIQVTNAVVPWDDFVKTQEGVVITKNTEELPAAEPEAEETVEEAEDEFDFSFDDDDDASLDDLFGDSDDEEEAPKKPAAKPKRRHTAKPRKPKVTVTYKFDGAFKANAQTKNLVKRINTMRTTIDTNLRKGGYYFFSANYAPVSANSSAANRVMPKLPTLMRNVGSRDAFRSAMRQVGLTSEKLINELYPHAKANAIQLANRIREEEDKKKWDKLLNQSNL